MIDNTIKNISEMSLDEIKQELKQLRFISTYKEMTDEQLDRLDALYDREQKLLD